MHSLADAKRDQLKADDCLESSLPVTETTENSLVDTDKFYEDILSSIDASSAHLVHTVLQWLAFADVPLLKDVPAFTQHPLTLVQIAQVASVDLSLLHPAYDAKRQVSPDRIVELCAGILKLEEVPSNRHCSDDGTVTRLAFVDDTARQFLLSDRIRSGPASRYSISEPGARVVIVNTCLAYLLHVTETNEDARRTAERFPLATYAALFWIDFLPEEPSFQTWELITCLFLDSQESYEAWLQLIQLADDSYLNNKHTYLVLALRGQGPKGYNCIAPPIVWASALGLTPIVQKLIQQRSDMNAAGATSASALYMAVHERHWDVVELLLEHGGDVANDYVEGETSGCRSEISRSPLYYATMWNDTDSLKFLLRDGTKYGRPGWKLENALGLAAESDKHESMRLLINAGADLNAIECDVRSNEGSGPRGGCALQKAAWYKSTESVRVLLDAGADANVRGGYYHTALQAAASRGYSEETKLLLEAGADSGLNGGSFGSALIASCWRGNIETTKMLLKFEDDVDTHLDLTDHVLELNFGTAGGDTEDNKTIAETSKTRNKYPYGLRVATEDRSKLLANEAEDPASEEGLRKRIAANMLAHAEYTKATFGFYPRRFDDPFTLLNEINHSATRISSRLREAGVQMNEDGRYFFNAIQAAVANERHAVVQLLLEHGATMPMVLVIGDEAASVEAEKIARMMRMDSSFSYEERTGDGSVAMASIGSVPPL